MSEWSGILTFESIEAGRAVFYCDDDQAPFKVGQRYIVRMTEDKPPERGEEDRRAVTKSASNPAAVAKELCVDPVFHRFAAIRMEQLGRGKMLPNPVTASSYIKFMTSIRDLEDLDIDPVAQVILKDIEVAYRRAIVRHEV